MRHPLADQRFGESGPVDLLIGGDLYPRTLVGAPYPTQVQRLYFTPTVFGQVVSGVVHDLVPIASCSLFSLTKGSIEDHLKAFWELEEPTTIDRSHPDDVQCEQHFVQTHRRTVEGRYVVRLPFKSESLELDDNKSIALRRFFSLESKCRRNPILAEKYKAFMAEYLALEHMSPVRTHSTYIIPHHGVWQEQLNEPKLRVVFDASCRSTRHSLNDLLHSGPKLQRDLAMILIRFRLYAVAVCADIVKMYRQIIIHDDDRKYQHILWRSDTSEAIQEFELNTLAEDEGSHFPLASQRVPFDMYVDDIVSGAETPSEALELISQLGALFAKGGFSLSKWASNAAEVLPCDREKVELVPIRHPEHDCVKILGLFWNSTTDSFSYVASPPLVHKITKRAMLSAVARIFDPLGLLAPVIFLAKVLMQEIWKARLDWDDELPSDLGDAWIKLMQDWQCLSSISVPRYISHKEAKHQLVGFCDASSQGYAATLYLRSESHYGDVKVALIKSKSKVAPLKFVSIARLELCGALLLARLISSITPDITREIFCFTDSQVVLSWLQTPAHELGVFEANRVDQILNIVPLALWNHVRSEDNPGDLASRGFTPQKLKHSTIWWNGPQWLSSPTSHWWKPITVVMSCSRASRPSALCSERRLPQQRAGRTSLLSSGQDPEQFSAEEIAEAELRCLRFVQRTYLPPELYQKSNNVPKVFAQLSPFLDERRIIRVGGRLQESSICSTVKHPILLPRRAPLTSLIIDFIHSKHFHAGPALTLALLRGKNWIPTATKLIRERIHRCVHCRIQRAKPIAPIMAPLPRARFEEIRPFAQTGVDYAGPFLIKESKRRNASLGKAYLCLFICMSSKALHLELVSALTTTAFLACLDRFISRRGAPSTIWSDHGTNFVGASRFLKEIYSHQMQNQTAVTNNLALSGVEWKFIPPRAPHFGGLWEAGIKSVKRLLSSSVGSQPFTFEELATALVKIEALLNSRPLCPLTEDACSFDFLTPGHFLVGGPLTPLPVRAETPLSSSSLIF
nr:uncharacterized protein LOC106692822 [Halyomorpha halys]